MIKDTDIHKHSSADKHRYCIIKTFGRKLFCQSAKYANVDKAPCMRE